MHVYIISLDFIKTDLLALSSAVLSSSCGFVLKVNVYWTLFSYYHC